MTEGGAIAGFFGFRRGEDAHARRAKTGTTCCAPTIFDFVKHGRVGDPPLRWLFALGCLTPFIPRRNGGKSETS